MDRFSPDEVADIVSSAAVVSETSEEENEHDVRSEDSTSENEEEEEEVSYLSKNGKISWSSRPIGLSTSGRLPAEFVLKSTPGPTRISRAQVHDVLSAFELFIPRTVEEMAVKFTNLEGLRRHPNDWKKTNREEMRCFIGVLILSGMFRSRGEAAECLWDSYMGRPIIAAAMSLDRFRTLTAMLRFDDRETRPSRRAADKLALVRDIWEAWLERLPVMYTPGENITVDERLIPFRGQCAFRQYMPRKPGKYGLKLWVASDSATSYAYNVQIYTEKVLDSDEEDFQEECQAGSSIMDGMYCH
nr:piggyBac transposable element-derived protein 4-like [Paramormyrops kingsleyae]